MNIMKMKKLLTVLLVAVLTVGCVFAFAACKKPPKYKVGAQEGTTGALYLKGDADMNFGGFQNIESKTYDSIGQAVDDMLNGNINCVVGDIEPAKAVAALKAGKVKVIDVALSTESYAIGVNKEDAQLLSSINATLAEMGENGKLAEIIANYNNENYDPEGVSAGTVDNTKSQLVVATNADFKPFEYKKGDKFVGIDIEIAKYIADKLEMELVIKDMNFDSVVTSVGKNGVDIAMAGLTVKESRKISVNFSDSYYTDSYQVLIVKADDTTFDGCTTKAEIEAKLKSL